jgi:hypothetical protein
VVPPPPPLVSEFPPKPNSKEEEIQLNIDMSTMFGKLNMRVHVTEMCKIPSKKRSLEVTEGVSRRGRPSNNLEYHVS